VHGLNRNEKYVPVVIEPDCGKLGYNLLVDWRESPKLYMLPLSIDAIANFAVQ
jgi:hypothetical protein